MGLIVGLSGVDGSGKTTVARSVTEKLQSLGQKATYHHEIDFVMLKLMFSLMTKLAGKRVAENIKGHLITGAENDQALVSDIYYILVWLDNLFAYLYFKLKRGIIVHDRWLYDFTTFFDHKCYRNRLVKRLFISFPRPDV